jgi:hypothetical protein
MFTAVSGSGEEGTIDEGVDQCVGDFKSLGVGESKAVVKEEPKVDANKFIDSLLVDGGVCEIEEILLTLLLMLMLSHSCKRTMMVTVYYVSWMRSWARVGLERRKVGNLTSFLALTQIFVRACCLVGTTHQQKWMCGPSIGFMNL